MVDKKNLVAAGCVVTYSIIHEAYVSHRLRRAKKAFDKVSVLLNGANEIFTAMADPDFDPEKLEELYMYWGIAFSDIAVDMKKIANRE
jgi:hypothetical protein